MVNLQIIDLKTNHPLYQNNWFYLFPISQNSVTSPIKYLHNECQIVVQVMWLVLRKVLQLQLVIINHCGNADPLEQLLCVNWTEKHKILPILSLDLEHTNINIQLKQLLFHGVSQ